MQRISTQPAKPEARSTRSSSADHQRTDGNTPPDGALVKSCEATCNQYLELRLERAMSSRAATAPYVADSLE